MKGEGKVRNRIWRWGKREIIYLSQHCPHQNDSCVKMGSDKSHFNVSLTVRDKVTRQRPQITPFEEKGEPKQIRTEVPFAYQPNALLPGQTGMPTSSELDLSVLILLHFSPPSPPRFWS